jgi:hypothetical protein
MGRTGVESLTRHHSISSFLDQWVRGTSWRYVYHKGCQFVYHYLFQDRYRWQSQPPDVVPYLIHAVCDKTPR